MVLLGASAAAQDEAAPGAITWPERNYNNQPAPGDLVLPMPCGGAMTFRPVAVPSDGALGDRRILIGAGDERFGYSEGARFDYLAGAFVDPDDPARRLYWIGKYEVTEGQAAAIRGECSDPTPADRLPVTAVTWIDAASLSAVYTEWLLANARDLLPDADGATPFLRLPTEVEWEYAVRGGITVSADVFRDRVFPMPEGLTGHVWFQGSRSANGRLQLTGLLAPNPLGLHDMLGNADEIMLEPFRANRLGRPHGQAGGFVVRGGNYLTSERDIRASYRQEVAHFNENGANHVRTIGFRLVISAPVLTSVARLESVEQAWVDLTAAGSDPVNDAIALGDDPLAALADLADGVEDRALGDALEGVLTMLRRNDSADERLQTRIIRHLVGLGAEVGWDVHGEAQKYQALAEIAEAEAAVSGPDDGGAPDASPFAESLAFAQASLNTAMETYVEAVIVVAENYTAEAVLPQLATVRQELEARGHTHLIRFVDRFAVHVADYRANGSVDAEVWRAHLAQP